MEIKEERGLGSEGGWDSGTGPVASWGVCGARSSKGKWLGEGEGIGCDDGRWWWLRGKERDREENHEPDSPRLVGVTQFSLS
ncbi:hypothetical protein MA16_Dca005588 [Dendrobium catenatum]|uniref:Uncharacterized protein n=1 Tax=Dendrobium catenatum TaxID=906689 RepID=A0A2I0WQ44_9ASPA|nr:hypothetical protein MA16_Dca028881 [Dendrobium catenatum]PKU77756.1 hypothetical protein MA16_Dca005588 [Dendrobium catenatum]